MRRLMAACGKGGSTAPDGGAGTGTPVLYRVSANSDEHEMRSFLSFLRLCGPKECLGVLGGRPRWQERRHRPPRNARDLLIGKNAGN